MRMKKLLTFLTLLTLSIGVTWAATVTYTTNSTSPKTWPTSGNPRGITTDDGFLLSIDKGSGNNGNNSTNYVQILQKNTFTVSHSSYTITEIKITGSNNNYAGRLSSNVGTCTLDGAVTTWSGNSKTVVFTANNPSGTPNNGQLRMTSIQITYDGGGSTPTTYSLTLPNVENGSFSVVDGSNNTISNLSQILSGTNITVTAIPNTGYTLEWMKANGVDVTNQLTASLEYIFNINDNTTITASFKEESTTPSGDYLFYESWSNTTGTGGNDGSWSGSIASGAVVSDQTGWTYENQSGGDNCLKLGTSSKKGIATTPSITVENGTVYTLTFKAGAWNGGSEYTNLILSATGATLYSDAACTIALSSVKMTKGAWSDYTVYVKATSTSMKIKWAGQNTTNSRFFLDEVKIVAPASAAHTISVTQPEEGGTINTNVATADAGDVITVTATPATGYELTALAYNGTPIDITSTPYTFTMPDADVTLTATFTAINYNIFRTITAQNPNDQGGWIGDWNENCNLPDGASGNDYVVTSTYGKEVQFKAGNNEGYKILAENVTAKDANNNNVPLTVVSSDNSGIVFKFNMPASNVTISAYFTFYQPDLYLMGNAHDQNWQTTYKMDYNSSNTGREYSIRTYFAADHGEFQFEADGTRYASGAVGAYWLIGENGDYEYSTEVPLYANSNKNYRVVPGIYDIYVNKDRNKVVVTPVAVELTFSPAAGEVYQGTTVTASSNLYTLLHAINSSITESSVTNEVSLDGTTFSGSVALDNTGSATVTGKATYGYIAPTATANYTVNEIPAGSEYTLVTDASELNNGDEIVFMSKGSGSGYAMSTTQATNNRPQTEEAITIINSKIVPTSDTQIITLEGATGAWYFNVGNGYLYAASSSNNYLKTETTADNNAKAIIVIGNDGAATIVFQGDNTHNQLRHNANNKIYSCYLSGQQPVYIFRKATGLPKVATPTFNPAQGTYTEAQSVTISCATDGATILYSTDGTNYSNYTGAITVSETTTIYAKATKSGMTESDVAQATYTINTPIQPGDGEFALVTNGNQIIAGREYIIVVQDLTSGSSTNPDHHGVYALSAVNAGTTTAQQHARKAVNGDENIMLAEGYQTATVPTGSEVEIFQLEGTTGAWKLHGTNGYLYGTQGSNYLDISSSIDNGWEVASIAIQSGSVAKIQFNNDSRWLQCNPNNNSGVINPYFSCYSSTQKQVYLYYREGNMVMPPVFTPNPGVYGIDVDVTISCPTSGATIYYTTDGTDPKTSSTRQEYTGEIVVSQTTTFKAVAVKGEETSSVTEATYTISKSTDIATVTLDYREPFTEGVGNFYVVNESDFSPVWTLDGNYGIKGTSFSGGVNYAATSRFISPIIDMTDATQPELTFSHQINSYFDNVTTQATLWIRETTDGTDGTWVQLPITFSDPVANGGWTNDVANIDLSNYAGKKVQISFLYTNPTEGSGAGTWEIQHFVVADNSEYKMVNNIAEFLALPENTKAKFRNPVTVLYDYAQYSSNSYHEYIWVKDESGYMQFYLIPTLNSSTESTLDPKAAYYENGDIIPAGFVVVKNYYENGKYVQAYSTEALDAGFELATQKGLADPDHYEFSTLNALTLSDADIAANCNRYITVEKVKIASKSGKNFTFANENGTVNACVGFNKYNGDGSLLKNGTTSADVTVPAVSDTYYNVKGIIQIWQGGWEFMPIEFTEWNADEVTLRTLCQEGVVDHDYKITNNLMGVYASKDGTKLWVKDDDGQAIVKYAPNDEYPDNFAIEAEGNTRLDQQYYDQSNWCEIQLTGTNAASFVGKIIKGGSIDGTFTNKTNPTMTGVTLTNANIYSDGNYEPNYYIPANFFGSQSCQTSQHGQPGHGDFFFMTPKPQEYVQIVWAIWDREHEQFIMSTDPNRNSHMFEGGFSISFDLNNGVSSYAQIQDGYGYNFTAIIKKTESKDSSYIVYPLDLNDGIDPATAIESVVAGNGEVKSVKFYNVAGIESATPFQGINIVVTEYTDGTRTTTKMLCR